MRFFHNIDVDDIIFGVMLLLIPSSIGGIIGGCATNAASNVSFGDLKNYAAAVSNRIDRVEFGLSLLAIPVQRKENGNE